MRNAILNLISENPRLTDKQIAALLELTEAEVSKEIAALENEGIIGGYRAIIDWSRVKTNTKVTALIELKVAPRRDTGFEEIASEILSFPEVESMHLMSGTYDLAVYVTGSSFQDIAMFVARRLSTLDSVLSTATHFMLKRYKDHGVLLGVAEEDGRGSDLL